MSRTWHGHKAKQNRLRELLSAYGKWRFAGDLRGWAAREPWCAWTLELPLLSGNSLTILPIFFLFSVGLNGASLSTCRCQSVFLVVVCLLIWLPAVAPHRSQAVLFLRPTDCAHVCLLIKFNPWHRPLVRHIPPASVRATV